MRDELAQVDGAPDRRHSIDRLLALGRGYLEYARREPNMIAVAFLPFEPANEVPEDPNPWNLLAAVLDELVDVGAMAPERRPGAEIVAWSAVHGFAMLRANRSFEVSGERDPDPERLLAAIAKSPLDLRGLTRNSPACSLGAHPARRSGRLIPQQPRA